MTVRFSARLLVLTLAVPFLLPAQGGYKEPPPAIAAMLDARPTPSLSLSPRRDWFVLQERKGLLPSIDEVAEPHLKLAGSRINPKTNGSAGTGGSIAMSLQRVRDRSLVPVRVPAGGRLGGPQWAPSGDRFVFTQTTDEGIALYHADTTGAVKQLVGPRINGTPGGGCSWLDSGTKLLCALVPDGRGPAPVRNDTPTGPSTQESVGRAAPAPTYQDLLRDATDEQLFDYYFTRQWAVVGTDGSITPWGPAGIITNVNPSPDGEWFLVNVVQKPYSYQYPWSRFPSRTEIWTADGTLHKVLKNQTTIEITPTARGAVLPGPRGWRWRTDAPATLMWTEALDDGDPKKEVSKRDRILAQEAPFTSVPVTFAETEWRAGGLTWGRADVALLSESWPETRMARTWIINPSNPAAAPRLLWERSTDDRYGNPGSPMMMQTPDGRSLLHFSRDGRSLWLTGAGSSPEGDRPFLDRLDLRTLQTTRLWQSQAPYYESIVAALDADRGTWLTRRESQDEPANYWQRDLVLRRAPIQLTDAPDPAPAFAGVSKERLTYTRADGVVLSGTLYLPPGYDRGRDGPLPTLFWVYPAEFATADAASQVTGSPYRFTRPGGASHLFLLTQGYAVFDNPTFPIVAKAGGESNDTYVEQLELSAKAAIDTLVAMGVSDRDRIAVGGHSYGAFTTANLLAHTRLFKAGLARSGAYNRTLTPFGFQSERRTYWEAQDVYLRMSPFNYAHQLKDPILFVHGMDDNNQGTFPIQSERMYAAVKGNGGTARLVMLPNESHGYAARESVGHAIAEMTEWLDRYLKPKAMVP
jgi:dipeptidyl aminopeptidase/acylaminoacyl peptidase